SLVGRTQYRTIGVRTLMERNGSIRFQSMAEYIQSCRGSDRRRLAAGILRINDAQGRFQSPMGNTGFGVHSGEVADGHTRGFTSGPGRRGNCDQWFEVSRHRQALANGWVHVIQEIGRVSRIQVAALAVSMVEPPPTATKPSNSRALANAIAS